MKEILKNKIRRKGFTLVETLVAISVLSLSILGTYTAVQSGLQKSIYVKDQIVAFYLVQEAMEYIHNVRDNNGLASINSQMGGGPAINWLTGLATVGAPCEIGKVCSIDSNAGTVSYCGTTVGSCAPLNQNSTTYLYGNTTGAGWSATKFKREVRFEDITGNTGKELLVTVTVSWGSYSFQVKQRFMNNR
jgi:prepilin-type N-terminal cleavage/methylation domain-containing protein